MPLVDCLSSASAGPEDSGARFLISGKLCNAPPEALGSGSGDPATDAGYACCVHASNRECTAAGGDCILKDACESPRKASEEVECPASPPLTCCVDKEVEPPESL